MNKSCSLFLAVFVGLFAASVYAQQPGDFNLGAYKQFLESHKDMTSAQLMGLHDAGRFRARVSTDAAAAAYFDSVSLKYKLTSGELSILQENGFVVTERLSHQSFGTAFADVYHKDLPVFISTDAILHSIHASYDAILLKAEESFLIPALDSLLAQLTKQLPLIAQKYSSYDGMKPMLNDVDVYLTVASALEYGSASPAFSENSGKVDTLLAMIEAGKPMYYPLFSSTSRQIDFSQFTPRGHYTGTQQLTRYFRATIWLGRTEIYLTSPKSSDNHQTDADIQRQTIDAVLIEEMAEASGAVSRIDAINDILKSLIGESDNVTLPNMESLTAAINLRSVTELLDTARWREFQDTLLTKSFAFQRILSQLLDRTPLDPEKVEPASSFLLLGQRFIVDSYVMGNVVYDRIREKRMLPSPLDVLFAVGNDAAAQLLKPELDYYRYSSDLGALRYLIDSYGSDFWTVSLYNAWLNSIRALNPPAERDTLPAFMRTAAWWQEKMNTQLASWAQLRHDNLLYAKQSYTPGITCSYPEGYVEPVPGFYDAVKSYAGLGLSVFRQPSLIGTGASEYFNNLGNIADTLGSISRKELSGQELSDAENSFIRSVLYDVTGCGEKFNGWYTRLFYGSKTVTDSDMVVADVHTAPTDSNGTPMGYVLHLGTGPVNTAIVTAELPGGGLTTFVGPVLSYYEHVSTNFERLTDEEWKTMYALAPSLRPDFVNIYLATGDGSLRSEGSSLLTGVKEVHTPGEPLPSTIKLAQNYPNPFNSTTVIAFSIPRSLSSTWTEITIYNINGQLVKHLLAKGLPAGNYTVRWDGRDDKGISVASGVYFCRLAAGGAVTHSKLVMVK